MALLTYFRTLVGFIRPYELACVAVWTPFVRVHGSWASVLPLPNRAEPCRNVTPLMGFNAATRRQGRRRVGYYRPGRYNEWMESARAKGKVRNEGGEEDRSQRDPRSEGVRGTAERSLEVEKSKKQRLTTEEPRLPS